MNDEPIMAPTHPDHPARRVPRVDGGQRLPVGQGARGPQTRRHAITHGKRRTSADTGLRLSRFFGMCEGLWTGLQADYEREPAKDVLGDKLDAIHPLAS